MTSPAMQSLIFKDEASWLQRLTTNLLQLTAEAISHRGTAHIALSGGSTPKAVYNWWNRQSLSWGNIQWWLGDERWVPPDSETSNERMVMESLARDKPNFKKLFHSWHLAEEPSEAAQRYEQQIIQSLGSRPAFDLILLGLGDDGHTASLFPHAPELDECARFAVSTKQAHLGTTRLTFTFPTLNSGRQVWFLVKGNDKKEMVDKLLSSSQDIPSGRVCARERTLFWLKEE